MEAEHTLITSLLPSKRRHRRVPDQLRKRAASSCDFCKVRRRKCVRDSSADGCRLCRVNNVECTSSIPRKPRYEGPSDRHRSRYRAMEELLGKLLPNIPIRDTDELLRLSQDMEAGSPVHLQHGLQAISATSPNPGAAHASCSSTRSDVSPSVLGSIASPAQQAPASDGEASFYERMLINSSGSLSYFGPSSSMAYVRKMRELLALYSKQNVERLPDTQQRLRDNFIQDPYARTMVEGHGEEPGAQCPSYPLLAGDGRQPTRTSSLRLARLLEVLPTNEETERLVDQFFVHVHPNLTLFHRPSFQTMLDRIRMTETRDIDAGWAACIRLVVGLGCEWRPSSTAQEATGDSQRLASIGERLVSDSLSELSQLMLSATLQSVTAMTLLAVYFTFANERNAAWILSGAAVRMGIGMGLHRGENALRRSNIHLSTTDRELRKQVWSSLFIFEQYTSSLFGRPSAVDGLEMLVEVPRESVLDQGFYRPLGLLPYDISLARIIGKIREVQVDQSLSPANNFDGLPDLDTCDALLQDLDGWKLSLPPFLRFDTMQRDQIYPSHFRQLVMLHVRYHYTRILLSRPFLLRALYVAHAAASSTTISDRILKYKDMCFEAATKTWTLIMCLWDKGEYNACLWLDGVFAYQCNLVLSLYLMDPTRTVDGLHRGNLQEMVRRMQQILVTGPGNKTMKRLVQISRDFTEIVGSLSPEAGRFQHDESETTPQNTSSAQDRAAGAAGAAAAAAGFDDNGSRTAVSGGENAAFFNWEFVVEPDLFLGNLVDDGSALDLVPGFSI